MTNPVKYLLVTAVLGAALTGCSDDEPSAETDGPTLVQMPVSESVLMVGGQVPDGDAGDERTAGKPVFVNGCLGAQNGGKSYLVVWPAGTNVAGADSDAIRIGDEVLEPGQSFVGTGTFISGQPFPEEFPQIPLKCLAPNAEKIMWVQEISEISD